MYVAMVDSNQAPICQAAISACAPHWTSALRLVRFSGAHRLASDKVTYGTLLSLRP